MSMRHISYERHIYIWYLYIVSRTSTQDICVSYEISCLLWMSHVSYESEVILIWDMVILICHDLFHTRNFEISCLIWVWLLTWVWYLYILSRTSTQNICVWPLSYETSRDIVSHLSMTSFYGYLIWVWLLSYKISRMKGIYFNLFWDKHVYYDATHTFIYFNETCPVC